MTRGPCTCCNNAYLNRGPWTPEEDALLVEYIKQKGDKGNWRKVPKAAGLQRCGKSCRLRWLNYLRPDIKRGKFSEDETNLIIQLHALLGNRWSIIAGRVPGRSDNEIKNYWNFHLSKKLLSMGIDPKNHKPLKLLQNTSQSSEKPAPVHSSSAQLFSFYSRNSSFSSSNSSFETFTSGEDNSSSASLDNSLDWSDFDQQAFSADDHQKTSLTRHQVMPHDQFTLEDAIFSWSCSDRQEEQELASAQTSCLLNLDFLEGPILESDGLLEVLEAL